jgi:tRNA (guanine37-N1)-methyltransferase
MKYQILSLFPQIINGFFTSSIMAKSVEKGLVNYNIINFRDFAEDKHKTCDDYTFGGGVGLVIKPEPLGKALESIGAKGKRVIYPTPSGKVFNQKYAKDLAQEKELIFICGRYEGIDQRIIDNYVSDEISIGDYVLSSGETATLVIIDAVYRLLEGVINKESLLEESFSIDKNAMDLLEYPHYTRPEVWNGMKVPKVLTSGHHENIKKWRLKKSLEKTLLNRPDLINEKKLSDEAREYLKQMEKEVEDGYNKSN